MTTFFPDLYRMKIGVAQTQPVKGDIGRNILQHKILIEQAAAGGADVLIFPELSLTGYEPMLAGSLAIKISDDRLNEFQQICDSRKMTIGVGAPTRQPDGVCISMILFQPGRERVLYSKRYLHPDEEPFFIPGEVNPGLIGENNDIALAICYEISVPRHAEEAFASGAKTYAASVAKFAGGMEKALVRLTDIAGKYAMTVLVSNAIGSADDGVCAGATSIWNDKGLLMAQLDDRHEGILIIDTDTGAIHISYTMNTGPFPPAAPRCG
jgi:predicted amidohydrolase